MRTAEQLLTKNEQIADGLEHGAIKPKTAEQLSQCVKLPIKLAELEMKMRAMVAKAGRTAPVLRSPLIRSMTPGLDPERIAPTDGATVRALNAEN